MKKIIAKIEALGFVEICDRQKRTCEHMFEDINTKKLVNVSMTKHSQKTCYLTRRVYSTYKTGFIRQAIKNKSNNFDTTNMIYKNVFPTAENTHNAKVFSNGKFENISAERYRLEVLYKYLLKMRRLNRI